MPSTWKKDGAILFKNHAFALLGLLAFKILTGTAIADPIIFYFDGIGSGTLGSTPFSSVSFQIACNADTANVFDFGGPASDNVLAIPSCNSTIFVAGIGATTFDALTFVQSDQTFQAHPSSINFLLTQNPGQDLEVLEMDVNRTDLDLYGLNTSVGPVVGTASSADYTFTFPTSLGDLSFTSISNFTFQAVPEPSIAGLLFGGCAAILFARRIRSCKSAEKSDGV